MHLFIRKAIKIEYLTLVDRPLHRLPGFIKTLAQQIVYIYTFTAIACPSLSNGLKNKKHVANSFVNRSIRRVRSGNSTRTCCTRFFVGTALSSEKRKII